MGARDEWLLRRFVEARARSDMQGAARWWRELTELQFDRVRGFVMTVSAGRLSEQERQEATQLALVRIHERLIATFRGTSMGEWVVAVRELVRFACMDAQRSSMRHSKHQLPIDDAVRGDDDTARSWDAQLFKQAETRRGELEAMEQDDDLYREGREFLDWALGRMTAGQREIIELDRQNLTTEEMMERTGRKRDALYKARERALARLRELREEWEQDA